MKVCKYPQNLFVVEIIGTGGHSSCIPTFIENDIMKLGKMISESARLTILSCYRNRYKYILIYIFFLSNEFAELQIHNLTAGDYVLFLRSAIDYFRWPFERFWWCSQSTTASSSPPPPFRSVFLKFHLIGRRVCLFYRFYILGFVFLTTSVCFLELLMEPLEGSVVTKEQ